MDTLTLVLSVAGGLLVGAIAALKVIAPKTKTTMDDTVLARLEALEAIVEKLSPTSLTPPTPPPA